MNVILILFVLALVIGMPVAIALFIMLEQFGVFRL